MNLNKICVYDMETDNINPYTCNPVQLAALMINPRTLQIELGSEFNIMMRPLDIDDKDYAQRHKDTIEWHANLKNCTSEQIVETWKNAPMQKDAFNMFKTYLLRHHTKTKKKSQFSAPVAAGYNIEGFDNIIVRRLCDSYGGLTKRGEVSLFHGRDQIDGMRMVMNWFENSDELSSYSMDSVRELLGMPSDNAHDALQDVRDTAWVITSFMKLHRRFAEQVTFKGSFNEQ